MFFPFSPSSPRCFAFLPRADGNVLVDESSLRVLLRRLHPRDPQRRGGSRRSQRWHRMLAGAIVGAIASRKCITKIHRIKIMIRLTLFFGSSNALVCKITWIYHEFIVKRGFKASGAPPCRLSLDLFKWTFRGSSRKPVFLPVFYLHLSGMWGWWFVSNCSRSRWSSSNGSLWGSLWRPIDPIDDTLW